MEELEKKLESQKKINLRKWLSDSLSMITFSVIVEAPRELAIGMTLEQTINSRLCGIPLDLVIGPIYGKYLDKARDYFNVQKVDGWLNLKRAKRIGVDALAFTSFMAPLYAGILYALDVEPENILAACGSAAAMSTLTGGPYGIYQDFIRKYLFKVKDEVPKNNV